jgi:hypothetical protein
VVSSLHAFHPKLCTHFVPAMRATWSAFLPLQYPLALSFNVNMKGTKWAQDVKTRSRQCVYPPALDLRFITATEFKQISYWQSTLKLSKDDWGLIPGKGRHPSFHRRVRTGSDTCPASDVYRWQTSQVTHSWYHSSTAHYVFSARCLILSATWNSTSTHQL